jgi:putative two-component system response regulator
MSNSNDFADKPVVLLVDDTPLNLRLMHDVLKHDYIVKAVPNGARAINIAQSATPPDLILLDIMMPEMDGYEVCHRLKADPRSGHIPIIFVTTKNQPEGERRGFALGAVDYITKPISPPILLARIKTHLTLKAATDFLCEQNDFLEQEVARRTAEMQAIQDVAILVVASLAGTRDNETANHILRTQRYVKALAERLQTHPRFATFLTGKNIELLYKSAPLHDIGKVGIPDHILLNTDRLTAEEFELMKSHTTLGRDAIEQAERRLGTSVPFLQFAKEITYSHQEKWDGSGYPEGLRGDSIPISARLMALADVYDALISRRDFYKTAMTHEQAITHLKEGRGTHFDPDMLDAFIDIQDSCRAIAERYADTDDDLQRELTRLKPFIAQQTIID